MRRLFGSIALAIAVPPASLLIEPIWLRYVVAAALAFAPIFFANLVFSYSFRDTQTADMAFASNLLGAVVGGAIEYVALISGYGWLLVVVGALYAARGCLRHPRPRLLADLRLMADRCRPAPPAEVEVAQEVGVVVGERSVRRRDRRPAHGPQLRDRVGVARRGEPVRWRLARLVDRARVGGASPGSSALRRRPRPRSAGRGRSTGSRHGRRAAPSGFVIRISSAIASAVRRWTGTESDENASSMSRS